VAGVIIIEWVVPAATMVETAGLIGMAMLVLLVVATESRWR
jgi:hypothetical protein